MPTYPRGESYPAENPTVLLVEVAVADVPAELQSRLTGFKGASLSFEWKTVCVRYHTASRVLWSFVADEAAAATWLTAVGATQPPATIRTLPLRQVPY